MSTASDGAIETICIAGMALRLRYADEALRRALPPVVRRFLVNEEERSDVLLTVRASQTIPPPDGGLLFDSGAVWRVFEDHGGYRIDCASEMFGAEPYKSARIARDFSEGTIFVRPDAITESMHPLDYPLDEVVIAHLLGRGRGVELHGCGIIDRDGRGQLFVGQSGAGKTTTARVWLADGDYEIVSDDRVIVRFLDGQWQMFGTPWHGEAELSAPASAPLAAVHILAQASETRMIAIPPARAAAALFGCSFPPFYDAAAVSFTIDCLDRLVQDIPVRRLRFMPDRSVIDCVRSAA